MARQIDESVLLNILEEISMASDLTEQFEDVRAALGL